MTRGRAVTIEYWPTYDPTDSDWVAGSTFGQLS